MLKRININTLIDLAVLSGITGFLLMYFSPEYLFSVSITTGGDTGSHYHTAKYLKDYLLPEGKISGWMQGNYGGFPVLQYYFPLPFLIMALFSLFVPLQIAFKIVTVLGIFLLPVCAYFSLRMMKYEFPVPVIGAVFTLPFLFIESNSIWGGNILSTLSGEFTYSIGFALSILFIGSLYNGITSGKHAFKNAVLIALTGLCHAYALLFAGVSSLFFLLTPNFMKKFKYLLKVHVPGFMLMGVWILPMLYYMSETTHYADIWKIESIKEVFPRAIMPFMAFALTGIIPVFIRISRVIVESSSFRQAMDNLFSGVDMRMIYLWSCVLTAGFLYLTAYAIGVVDIRFAPFAQALLLIISGVELGRLMRYVKLKRLAPAIVLLSVVLWTANNERNIQNWIQWNYTGFENKRDWPLFSEINKYLKGTVSDPRVFYEHSHLHRPFGTERAFESLPMFSGRSTLEGLYMESSPNSPFVFYIQSEMSKEPSCPLPAYACSPLNLRNGAKHLVMFNVSDIIVRNDAVKAEIKNYPEFVLKKEIGPYGIYAVSGNKNRYVAPLKYKPVLYTKKDWRTIAYRWFRSMSANDAHIVFDNGDSNRNGKYFKAFLTDDNLPSMPKIPLEGSCEVAEDIKNEEINIKTDCINKPLLIKVSYHPGWKVEGAAKIFRASPSFMLIFPERNDVRLRFSPAWIDYAGAVTSLFAVCMVLITPILKKTGSQANPSFPRRRESTPLSPPLVRGELNSIIYRWIRIEIIRPLLILTTIAILAITGVSIRKNNPAGLYRIGRDLYDRKEYANARSAFGKVINKVPCSTLAHESSYYLALTYFSEGNYQKAIDAFMRLVRHFPESYWSAEAYYHIGMSYNKLGNINKAEEAFKIVIDKYPDTIWAKYSREQIK